MASSARIDELIKKFDENPRRYFAPLANEYRKAGELEQAIFICEEYLPQQPGHMSGHIVYGQVLFELNRHEEARGVFETALSLDPENLIALRHLGDIARVAGDPASARMWYQRVLEADPRNEEIAQLMLALLSADEPPAGTATPLATPAVPPVIDQLAPTPLYSPAVSATPAASDALEIEKASDTPLRVPRVTTPPVAAPAPVDEKNYVSRHAPKEEDLLDLDNFDLGGVPLSSLRESKDTAGEAPADSFGEQASQAPAFEQSQQVESLTDDEPFEAASFQAPSIEAESFETESFEADPFAIASRSDPEPLIGSPTGTMADSMTDPLEDLGDSPMPIETPEIELAADMALGLPEDGLSPSFVDGAETLEGVESFEAGILPTANVETQPLEMESFVDFSAPPNVEAPVVAEMPPQLDEIEQGELPESVSFDEPDALEEPAAAPAFVTETMATLYLQQGHLESALDIYRQLVDQRPGDEALRQRMFAVEDQIAAAAVGASAFEATSASASTPTPTPTVDESFESFESHEDAPAAHSYGGPTIREFLSGIVGRRPSAPEPNVAVMDSGESVAVESESFTETYSNDAPATESYTTEAYTRTSYATEPYSMESQVSESHASQSFQAAEVPAPTAEAAAEPAREPEQEPEREAEPEPVVEAQAPRRPSRPTPSETVTGSLGVLFSGADAAEQDAAAAQTLAEAFAEEGPDTAPLEGMPAHRASSELSLNHVFKGSTQPRGNGEGGEDFSFDEFFTESATAGTTPATDAPPVPPEGAEDIAQFNAWLNGLKKT